MTAVFIIMAWLYLALLALRVFLSIRFAKTLPAEPSAPLEPGTLTVAQAILSGDPELETHLAANLAALPEQSFLWMIDEDDPEAFRITAKWKREGVRVIACPPCPDGLNPKAWKLKTAAAVTATPLLAVVDDDTLLSARSAALLAEAAPVSTVATGLPCYANAGNVSSRLLAQFVNNQSFFTYLGTAAWMGPLTINGMGYVMRKSELQRCGGFESILPELTDDLAMARRVLDSGGTIHQSLAPLQVYTSVKNFCHYWQIMHRWYVFALILLNRERPAGRLAITVLHGLAPLVMLAQVSLAGAFPSAAGWAALATVLLARQAVLSGMQRRFFGESRPRPVLSVLSELLQPFHLVHALCWRTIRWRSRRYRVMDSHRFTSA